MEKNFSIITSIYTCHFMNTHLKKKKTGEKKQKKNILRKKGNL